MIEKANYNKESSSLIQGGLSMREGMIPTVLGTAVTAAGSILEANSMKNKRGRSNKMAVVAAGVVGFGLAHMVLGGIDLVEHRR